MHVSAWGMWAVWALSLAVCLVWCAKRLVKLPRTSVVLTLSGLTIAAPVALVFSQSLHGDRPWMELAITALAWSPVVLPAWVFALEHVEPLRKATMKPRRGLAPFEDGFSYGDRDINIIPKK